MLVAVSDLAAAGPLIDAVFGTTPSGDTRRIPYRITGLPPSQANPVARLVLDYRAEITWPGSVVTGTRIASVGRSSIRMEQAVFQGERCVATAETVIVQTNEQTRKSKPFSPAAAEWLHSFVGSR